jgi:hypothetical protein
VADALQGEVWVDRGCGAFYPVNTPITIRYWASRNAAVTLTLRSPDGSERVLVRQIALAGVTYTYTGTVTQPLGLRRLFLDVSDGVASVRPECAYSAAIFNASAVIPAWPADRGPAASFAASPAAGGRLSRPHFNLEGFPAALLDLSLLRS